MNSRIAISNFTGVVDVLEGMIPPYPLPKGGDKNRCFWDEGRRDHDFKRDLTNKTKYFLLIKEN